eukprot:TRINITY_DN1370_c0_g1::TRINITY_DN1370_c0_g1_i1::g.19944::m.19944 TRINITY_DN1370_c0_g1::TRINITY_DN1370_c0_g1_i1::g.19944  ORF type:complete len:194 (-),score=10.95 TRINITY_DN1370_c0_g1_i1:126-707(-)
MLKIALLSLFATLIHAAEKEHSSHSAPYPAIINQLTQPCADEIVFNLEVPQGHDLDWENYITAYEVQVDSSHVFSYNPITLHFECDHTTLLCKQTSSTLNAATTYSASTNQYPPYEVVINWNTEPFKSHLVHGDGKSWETASDTGKSALNRIYLRARAQEQSDCNPSYKEWSDWGRVSMIRRQPMASVTCPTH